MINAEDKWGRWATEDSKDSQQTFVAKVKTEKNGKKKQPVTDDAILAEAECPSVLSTVLSSCLGHPHKSWLSKGSTF